MKILYVMLTICLFLYAEHLKNVELIEINKPFFVIQKEYRDDEAYIEGEKNNCNTQIVQDFQNKNIIKFFQTAKEFDYLPLSEYCTIPCIITGKIKLDGKIWDFKLNEGGYAVLKRKDEERYFGDESKMYECGV